MSTQRPNISTLSRVEFDIRLSAEPALLAALDRFTPAHTLELELTVAKLTADLAKLRKSLDKIKAAQAKAAEEETAEDAAAAEMKAKMEEQIAALQAKLDAAPAEPTEAEKAQAEKDQAELDALVAEFDALDGDDATEPAPETPAPTPEPTPTPTPEPTPAPTEEDLPVEEQPETTPPAA